MEALQAASSNCQMSKVSSAVPDNVQLELEAAECLGYRIYLETPPAIWKFPYVPDFLRN